jgi:hypothetical protein
MRLRLILLPILAVTPRQILAQEAGGEPRVRVLSQHHFDNHHIDESSGLVRSRTQPGILWTLNDSNNPPELFATDSLGTDRGVVKVAGAENVDWEALGIAHCGSSDCLYAADVGDNRENRSAVVIYRVQEPRVGRDSVVQPDLVLRITYPDKPHNVEAVFVTGTQDIFIITKSGSEPPAVYRVPGTAWPLGEATAELVQTLPIPSNESSRYFVTDATLSEDERRVAIRTYRYIYFFSFDGNRLTPEPGQSRCEANGLDIQGEGIAWLGGDTLATSSERQPLGGGTISRVVCRP